MLKDPEFYQDVDDDPYYDQDDGCLVYHTTDLTSHDDGTFTGHDSTNDNLDKGYPSESDSWPVRFPSVAALKKRYPRKSPWTGCMGAKVEVFVDGEHWDPEDPKWKDAQ